MGTPSALQASARLGNVAVFEAIEVKHRDRHPITMPPSEEFVSNLELVAYWRHESERGKLNKGVREAAYEIHPGEWQDPQAAIFLCPVL
jgi:hypothetical protein